MIKINFSFKIISLKLLEYKKKISKKLTEIFIIFISFASHEQKYYGEPTILYNVKFKEI
jgi:hypothetical protein